MSDAPEPEPLRPGRWVALRLLGVFASLLLVALGVYLLQDVVGRGAAVVSVTFSVVLVLPYCLGALAGLIADWSGRRRAGEYTTLSFLLVLAILVVGGVVLREGLICIVMLAPVWITCATLGAFTTYWLHAAFRRRARMSCAGFLALPLLALAAEPSIPTRTDTFDVRRSVVVDAPPSAVWPHLVTLDGLSDSDGVWTLTHDVLGVPRPRSAVASGRGPGAVRRARWGEAARFEEHVTEWVEGERLGWDFAFPDDSIARHTDRHISPDGPHLDVARGGYVLVPLAGNRTRLELWTQYRATTPVNHYAAVWGEVMLGDVQRNILAIVRARAVEGGEGL